MTKPTIEPCPKCGDKNYKSIYSKHSKLFEIVCNECGFYQMGNSSISAIVNWNIASKECNKDKHTDTERLDWLIDHIWKCAEMVWPRHIIDSRMNREKANNVSSPTVKTRDELNAELSQYSRHCEYDKEFWGDDNKGETL